MLVDDRELTERAARIGALLDDIESFPDPEMQARASEIVQGLLILYGEGLARMLSLIEDEGGSESAPILRAFAQDELISHLLLLHDLHPLDLETRVLGALDDVRPYLESHGGNVDLLGVEDGVARLKLQGSCSGCPSSTVTLKLAIEEAINKAAPDLEGIVAEGVAEPQARPVNFLPTSDVILLKQKQQPVATTGWLDVATEPSFGVLSHRDVAGTSLLFLRADDSLYAYRNACAECGSPIDEGILQGAVLSCPRCARRYDVHHAGRALDNQDRHLQPVPLLVQDGRVTVALGDG